MKNKILFCLLLLLSFACNKQSVPLTQPVVEPTPPAVVTTPSIGVMRDISSMELVADMKSGINLGNSLDALGADETAWGNPRTTSTMIKEFSRKGFKTLRLPVSWDAHMGPAPDYTIELSWLNRVKQLTGYALEEGMYVIIDTHHEGSWIIPTKNKSAEVTNKLTKLWTQIALHFKDHSDYVLFDILNEPRHEGSANEWSGGTEEERAIVNQYHKASLDAIRATGGNNATRHLLVSTYAASSHPNAIDGLVIPNNDERTIVSIHTYFPYRFTLLDPGGDTAWGTEAEKSALDAELDKIHDKFIANGRAVIMGEWGSKNKDNTAARITHATYYAAGCAARKLAPVYWDDGGDFAIFDRNTLTWHSDEIADAVINATK